MLDMTHAMVREAVGRARANGSTLIVNLTASRIAAAHGLDDDDLVDTVSRAIIRECGHSGVAMAFDAEDALQAITDGEGGHVISLF
ncbi:hypothetical protein [Mangrovicella endophytica]|uniref:hypothetical protein n=1 Tax=Mangrovicella endophytica TaxID=2066697 RepID=UPI0012FFD63E|nr:hypothetical protein [Mangrovicella endophytica]